MTGWTGPEYFFEAVISIFAIINPVGNLPVLAGLTEDLPPPERRRVFRTAGLVALGILLTMAILGEFLLRTVFHISIHEFTFGGGLLLVVVGIRNIVGGAGTERRFTDAAARHDAHLSLAVTPIASPLLVGPGTIVTVMLIVQRYEAGHGPLLGRLYAIAAGVTAFALVMLILQGSRHLLRLMGRIGTLAVGRIMQIFIVAIGVHFMFSGLRAAFPALAG